MGNVQGRLDLRVHSGAVQFTQDGGTTWSSFGGTTILARAQALLPTSGLDTVLGTDFESSAWFAATNGSGGTSVLSKVDKGGVVLMATSAAGGGSTIITPAGAPSWVDNARTAPWYFYARIKATTGADAVAAMVAGMAAISGSSPANPAIEFGVIGALSTTNFAYHITNGGGANVANGTGPVLDTNWHALEITNDGTTVTFYFDGVSIGTTAATNVGTVPMMFEGAAVNGGTAANRAMNIDKAWFACQGN